ncbi:MAG: acyl-CoA/acyl-ACP dehydrogenase [Bacteriovorax sp.]|nr:acyl-CoA/acyl-ACP dehydrogenase [Bacteriovorax sp.]
MNFYDDSPEWKWLFKNAIDWNLIIPLYYNFPTKDGFKDQNEVIDFLGELQSSIAGWCAGPVADLAEDLDKLGSGEIVNDKTIYSDALKKLYQQGAELEIFGLNAPVEYGGLNAPYILNVLSLGFISRASMSACAQLSFSISIIDMIHTVCKKEHSEKWIPKIMKGVASGCMAMTEADHGSDLGNMKTIAKVQKDGIYFINGNKIFITNGGGGVAFVLSKTYGGKVGLKGLSLFFVEQVNDDGTLNFRIAKNEHKMGLNGSFTCELVFENTIGHLIGKEGEGLELMLNLMNEARVSTAFQALGGAEGALDFATKYAHEREAFGKKIDQLPLMKRNLEDYHTECDAIRALLVDTASHYNVFHFFTNKKYLTGDLNEEEEKTFIIAKIRIRKRTPLVKYYATEAGSILTQKALFVLGGHGYMKEYPLERFVRDSFGPIVYEGTSQIQALMAMKDLLKYVMKNPQSFFANIVTAHPIAKSVQGAKPWEIQFQSLRYTFKKNLLKLLIKCLKPKNTEILNIKMWKTEKGIEQLMIHAETLCQGLSYLETLKVLRNHATKDETRYDLFKRYHNLVLPRLNSIYTDWDLR